MIVESKFVEVEWDAETRSVSLTTAILNFTDNTGKYHTREEMMLECRTCSFILYCTNNIEKSLSPYILIRLSERAMEYLHKNSTSECGVVNPKSITQAKIILESHKVS